MSRADVDSYQLLLYHEIIYHFYYKAIENLIDV